MKHVAVQRMLFPSFQNRLCQQAILSVYEGIADYGHQSVLTVCIHVVADVTGAAARSGPSNTTPRSKDIHSPEVGRDA